jgi:hypothetical protein
MEVVALSTLAVLVQAVLVFYLVAVAVEQVT